jgi:hypothetical protein
MHRSPDDSRTGAGVRVPVEKLLADVAKPALEALSARDAGELDVVVVILGVLVLVLVVLVVLVMAFVAGAVDCGALKKDQARKEGDCAAQSPRPRHRGCSAGERTAGWP